MKGINVNLRNLIYKKNQQKLETGMGRERRGEARVFREVDRAESTVK